MLRNIFCKHKEMRMKVNHLCISLNHDTCILKNNVSEKLTQWAGGVFCGSVWKEPNGITFAVGVY